MGDFGTGQPPQYNIARTMLGSIPFYPALGNHDGNETERRRDLDTILDFAFPQNKPARYYTFTYGGLAQFFALDTTSNTESGPARPPGLEQLRHWFALFTGGGVKVVFSGHEHNFQASEVGSATGGIRFFVSGAGGELRRGNVQKEHAEGAHSGLGGTESLSGGRPRRQNDEGDTAFLPAAEHRGCRRRLFCESLHRNAALSARSAVQWVSLWNISVGIRFPSRS
jgi:hypothetical protein